MKDNKFREKINYIFTIIFAVNFVLCWILELYFLVLNKNKSFAYAQMSGLDKVLFVMLFVALFIITIMLLFLIYFASKEDEPYKNYTVVPKDTYDSMEKELLNKEYENIHQDLEIKTLKVRLSSFKLRFNLLKKFFKHKK